MNIESKLANLSLNKNQIKIYLTLLQLGSANIQDIAQKAGIKRTTAYSILDTLLQKGLVNFSVIGAHREYSAENPKKIPAIFQDQQKKIQSEEKAFKEILPELLSIYNVKGIKPKIRTYEGLEGIKKIFDESIEVKLDEEMLVYSAYEEVNKYLRQYIQEYIKDRVNRGLKQRCIAEITPQAIELQANDTKELRTTRLIDKNRFPLLNQVIIYGNKIYIASYKDLLGIIIESSTIAKTQKSIFELAWIAAGIENK